MDDDYANKRLLELKPIGLREGVDESNPLREVLGTTGTLDSLQVEPASIDAAGPGSGDDGTQSSTSYLPKIIIVFNGKLFYCNILGSVGAPVPM